MLAADTVVAVGRRILPKAADMDEVRACLALLSGRRHHAITAVILVSPDGSASERVVDTASPSRGCIRHRSKPTQRAAKAWARPAATRSRAGRRRSCAS